MRFQVCLIDHIEPVLVTQPVKCSLEYFRAADPTRLVHYEGIVHDRRYESTSDIESCHIEPLLVTQPVKCSLVRVMGGAHGVDIIALHIYHILKHFLVGSDA